MTTYHNLPELLENRGFETPYSWGRALYKWVDCGPWVSFITETAPKKTIRESAVIAKRNNMPVLLNPGKITEAFRNFLCFEPDGTHEEHKAKTDFAEYLAMVQKYVAKRMKNPNNRQITVKTGARWIMAHTETTIPATHINHYYADPDDFDLVTCIGIKIGSIVEGSDVEVGPETLLFPITET